ncbi:MAG TPA: TSUP family transporter, partial [Streptomyces sp.]|nr:TSUP family transporter [Streptomyces sp.]
VVLGGIVVTAAGWAPRPRRLTLVSAGAVSGIMGTATSIGGPPMALVWQRSPGPRLRSTMSAFFLVGSAVSLVALAVSGGLDGSAMGTFAALAPAAFAGCVLSRFVNRWLSRERLRWTAITVSAIGALVLVGQQLL